MWAWLSPLGDGLRWALDKLLETPAGKQLLASVAAAIGTALVTLVARLAKARNAIKHGLVGGCTAFVLMAIFSAILIWRAPEPTAESYAEMSNASLRSATLIVVKNIRTMARRNTAADTALWDNERADYEAKNSNEHRHDDVHAEAMRKYGQLVQAHRDEYVDRFQSRAQLLHMELNLRLSSETLARLKDDPAIYADSLMPTEVANDLERRALSLPAKEPGP